MARTTTMRDQAQQAKADAESRKPDWPSWKQLYRLAATMAELLELPAPTDKRAASELIQRLSEAQVSQPSTATDLPF